MNKMRNLTPHWPLWGLLIGLAALLLASLPSNANPYASCLTTNGDGKIYFFMNETGAVVTVTFDDNSTLNMGYLDKGPTNFTLPNGINGYKISCFKAGSGSMSLISSDTFSNSVWSNACGFAVNHNPKIGALFGRLYAGNSDAFGGSAPKSRGIYALNPDQTLVAFKANPDGTTFTGGNFSSNFKSPGRMRVAPDNTLLVADGQGAGNHNRVYIFQPDLSSSTVLLGPSSASGLGDVFGTPCAVGSLAAGNLVLYLPSAGVGAPADTNCIKGPLTAGSSFNCIYAFYIGSGPLPWNKRPDYAYTAGLDGISQLRPEVDVEADGKVVVGFGRSNLSNPNIQILRAIMFTNGVDNAFINKQIQDAMKDATNWLYTSGVNPPFNSPPPNGDPWRGDGIGSGTLGTYGGVRVSPDGLYLASMDNNNGITIANIENGIPNDNTIFGSLNPSSAGNQAGIDWDAADNIWAMSRQALSSSTANAQSKLRCYSLGQTATCVTSNDWSCTNGTFAIIPPDFSVSLQVITPNGSQNYTNNPAGAGPGQNPGAPIPAVIRIKLNKPTLATSVVVNFTLGGSATYFNQYRLNTNEAPNSITINPNNIVFPAGTYGGANGPNWNVDVKIIPTAAPVSGAFTTATIRLQAGTNYSAVTPLFGTVGIINTGPQLVNLGGPGQTAQTGMNRGIPNDYARFRLTRLGDTNGPGNDSVNTIVGRPLTVTNVNFYAQAGVPMAVNPTDYTAAPQNFNGSTLSSSSSSTITINPGNVIVEAAIGNPVEHANTSLIRTNMSVVINLTNTATASVTNTSSEGATYTVNTATVTLNEFDNANGGETVIWSNPLTNAADSVNWTLVFASTAQGFTPVLPLVQSNYDNSAQASAAPYTVWFGKSVQDPGNDGFINVPPSPTMVNNGWTTALKVSVNKAIGNAAASGINLYPQSGPASGSPIPFQTFAGNYALRFDMYLSLYDFGVDNPAIGQPAREFAAFGINHNGTNANWRLNSNPLPEGQGSYPINADGEWCAVDASSGSLTPADWDLFISPLWSTNSANTTAAPIPLPFTTNFVSVSSYSNVVQDSPGHLSGPTNFWPNPGVLNSGDQYSQNNNGQGGTPANGILKNPPFVGINNLGGAPDNAWVDVSFEVRKQTNINLKVAGQAVFPDTSMTAPVFGSANAAAPYSGTPMLGYLDPNADPSDTSAFVYYSNLRVVELSPFIPWTNQPLSLIVTQGASFTLQSAAMFGSNPMTNLWFAAITNGATVVNRLDTGAPTGPVIGSNYVAATSGSGSLTVNNIQSATNYITMWVDQAGMATSWIARIEVVNVPNKNMGIGTTNTMTVAATGNAPPNGFQWMFYGTNLVNQAHYQGVTTATLTISNVQPADAGVYSNKVTNVYYVNAIDPVGIPAYPAGTLTTVPPPSGITVTPSPQTVLWGQSVSFTVAASAGDPVTGWTWQKGSTKLFNIAKYGSSTNTATLTINNVTTADAAANYNCVLTYSGGTVGSPNGTLNVTVPPPFLGAITANGTTVNVPFSSTSPYDTVNAFTLARSPTVNGTYTNMPAAQVVFSTNAAAANSFQVAVPQTTDPAMFYKVSHVP